MEAIAWYTGHVPRRLQRALSLPASRPKRIITTTTTAAPPFTFKTGDTLLCSLLKFWPVRTDLAEVFDWRLPQWTLPASRLPVLRAEVTVPGLPSMLDNRSISFQGGGQAAAARPAGIGSFAVNRGADARRQHACYGNRL